MKKILVTLFSIVLVISLTGCNKKVVTVPTENSKKEEIKLEEKEYSVRLNDTVNIGDEMVVSLYDVSDSRCPANVECYWQGELSYSITINGDYQKISTVRNPKLSYKNYEISIVSSKCDEITLVFNVEKIK